MVQHEEEMFHAAQSGFMLPSGSVYLNFFGAAAELRLLCQDPTGTNEKYFIDDNKD